MIDQKNKSKQKRGEKRKGLPRVWIAAAVAAMTLLCFAALALLIRGRILEVSMVTPTIQYKVAATVEPMFDPNTQLLRLQSLPVYLSQCQLPQRK